MVAIKKKTLVQQMDGIDIVSYPRPHLGASSIGHPCSRALVYKFRYAYKEIISGRLNRIFRMGDKIEDLIIDALASIDINVFGSQRYVPNPTGHTGGSIDGLVKYEGAETFLFEAKSMNVSNYNTFKREGVEESHPKYFAQIQMYMGRLNLPGCMFVAMNKNTQDLHIEIVLFDKDAYDSLCEKETKIIECTNIEDFPRIGNGRSWFECKMCSAKDACYDGIIERNCRTCGYSYAAKKGQWMCTHHEMMIDDAEQKEGCKFYHKGDIWG